MHAFIVMSRIVVWILFAVRFSEETRLPVFKQDNETAIVVSVGQRVEFDVPVQAHTNQFAYCRLTRNMTSQTGGSPDDLQSYMFPIHDFGSESVCYLTGTPPDLTLTVRMGNVREEEEGQWRLELTTRYGESAAMEFSIHVTRNPFSLGVITGITAASFVIFVGFVIVIRELCRRKSTGSGRRTARNVITGDREDVVGLDRLKEEGSRLSVGSNSSGYLHVEVVDEPIECNTGRRTARNVITEDREDVVGLDRLIEEGDRISVGSSSSGHLYHEVVDEPTERNTGDGGAKCVGDDSHSTPTPEAVVVRAGPSRGASPNYENDMPFRGRKRRTRPSKRAPEAERLQHNCLVPTARQDDPACSNLSSSVTHTAQVYENCTSKPTPKPRSHGREEVEKIFNDKFVVVPVPQDHGGTCTESSVTDKGRIYENYKSVFPKDRTINTPSSCHHVELLARASSENS